MLPALFVREVLEIRTSADHAKIDGAHLSSGWDHMASQVSTKFGSRAVLLSLAMAANTSLLVWQPAVSAEEKAAAPSPYEKYSAQAQTYFDGGKFLTAEKSFRRALAAAQKAGDDAKTSDALVAIGKCLVKEEKFPLAADMFKQAITLDKEKNIDASAANAQMNELASVYKNIDWTGARQEISRLITDAGVDNAYGTRSTDGTTHVRANLKAKWVKSTDDLYKEYGPDSMKKNEPSGKLVMPPGMEKNPLKAIRLDKIIEFDITRDGGKYKVLNIKGISVNVGIWAKIAEIALDVDENNSPFASVRAGAMGVSQTKKINMPQGVYSQFHDGIDQVDPFVSLAPKAPPATAPSLVPGASTGASSSGSSSTDATPPPPSPEPATP